MRRVSNAPCARGSGAAVGPKIIEDDGRGGDERGTCGGEGLPPVPGMLVVRCVVLGMRRRSRIRWGTATAVAAHAGGVDCGAEGRGKATRAEFCRRSSHCESRRRGEEERPSEALGTAAGVRVVMCVVHGGGGRDGRWRKEDIHGGVSYWDTSAVEKVVLANRNKGCQNDEGRLPRALRMWLVGRVVIRGVRNARASIRDVG
jgi:hypothetical protein